MSSFSSLPVGLLQMIAGKLKDIIDYVSFRGVCKFWRSVATPGNAPKQLPWLLLPYNPNRTNRSFYSLSTRRTYIFDCDAALVGRDVCGSSFGWLALIAPDAVISLWNPLTKATIALPPITGFPPCLGQADDAIYTGYRRPGYPLKVSLSSSPAAPDCMVIVVLSMSHSFAYYVGCGVVLDVQDPSTWSEILFHDSVNYLLGTFLVKAADDDLYMVYWSEDRDEVSHIRLFKLVYAVEKGYRWQRIHSLGDFSLFLSRNHESLIQATDFPGGMKNYIYFSDFERENIYVFNLNRNKFQLLRCQMKLASDASCSTSTWVMPSLE